MKILPTFELVPTINTITHSTDFTTTERKKPLGCSYQDKVGKTFLLGLNQFQKAWHLLMMLV